MSALPETLSNGPDQSPWPHAKLAWMPAPTWKPADGLASDEYVKNWTPLSGVYCRLAPQLPPPPDMGATKVKSADTPKLHPDDLHASSSSWVTTMFSPSVVWYVWLSPLPIAASPSPTPLTTLRAASTSSCVTVMFSPSDVESAWLTWPIQLPTAWPTLLSVLLHQLVSCCVTGGPSALASASVIVAG